MADDRRYSREEVALVLRRLGELQVRDAPAGELTRVELEDVAREAGLDTRHMETALAEIEGDNKREARFMGFRLFVLVRRSVPGAVTPAKLNAAVALINRSVGIIGDHQIMGEALTWFGRHVAVSVTQHGEAISIQIEERFHNTARSTVAAGLGTTVPMGMFTFVGLAEAAVFELLAFGIGLTIPLAAYGMVRIAHRRRVSSTEERLNVLGDQLAALLRD